jgi:hypothetical protein
MTKPQKFFLFGIISILIGSFSSDSALQAQQTEVDSPTQVSAYLFHLETCPHCRDQIAWWQDNPELLRQVNLQLFEARNEKNRDLFVAAANKVVTDQTAIGAVPFLVIGEQALIGFDDNTTPGEIQSAIASCQTNGCKDVIENLPELIQAEATTLQASDTSSESPIPQPSLEPKSPRLPLIGSIDTSTLSLPLLSVVLGLMDGFNPCAMWVLFFLITLLLKVENPRRRWILGITFIVASGAVYFFLMAAWLNLFLLIGFLPIIRISIGLLALVSGAIHLRDALKKRQECKVIKGSKRQQIMQRLTAITQTDSIWIAMVLISLLAVSVNVVELLCSAGLPAVFTHTLSQAQLPSLAHYGYIVLYLIFFMLDDLVVFAIAMLTLQTISHTSAYQKVSGIIGGLVLLGIGVNLLIK